MWRYRCKGPWLSSRDLFVGLRLRGAPRRLRQRTDDGAPRQIDLERVVPEALGVAQHDVGGLRERSLARGLAAQRSFGLRLSPGPVGDAAQRETRLADVAAVELEADRDGHQRERVGQTVADLE